MASEASDPVATVQAARRDPERVVVEGLHALKHALRFGARVETVLAEEGLDLAAASAEVAPDLPERLPVPVEAVRAGRFAAAVPRRPPVPVAAVALRPEVDPRDVLAHPAPSRVVLLEEPVHLGNLGAAVRVAAAAGAAGVVTVGRADPWHPAAVRGAAGLQFAVPTVRVPALPTLQRPVVAIHPGGEPGLPAVPARSVLAFGTERRGLSSQLLGRADRSVAIPMRRGVSSLNLATAVAVALYALPTARAGGRTYDGGEHPRDEDPP